MKNTKTEQFFSSRAAAGALNNSSSKGETIKQVIKIYKDGLDAASTNNGYASGRTAIKNEPVIKS
jgi:hypothetical protein